MKKHEVKLKCCKCQDEKFWRYQNKKSSYKPAVTKDSSDTD